MADPEQKKVFLNRELSWLEFNQRVLEEAMNASVPPLERLKFLAITSSNLDEFFMVRVGSLLMQWEQGVRRPDISGRTPARQLQEVGERVQRLVDDQYRCYRDTLEPLLASQGVRRVRPQEFSAEQLEFATRHFEEMVYPLVTPMPIDLDRPLPVLLNRGLYAAVRLKPVEGSHKPRHAVLPIERSLSRFITLPSAKAYEFVLLEDLVAFFVGEFFPGERIAECVPFRITRNADMSVREDMAADLLAGMEKIIAARKTSDCIRLELGASATVGMARFLRRLVDVRAEGVYRIDGPLNLGAFMQVANVKGFDALKNDEWPPQPFEDLLPGESMFERISRGSVLLYHPYDSFEPVLRFINEAADDPDVLAIKQILYRTSSNSPVVAALRRAAERGKNVTAIVEIKARFDEERNIEWARALELAGVQVIYGIRGLKTHAKLCMVLRREVQGIQRYMHFGTGNYNENTARLYSDASYMTCDADLGRDAATFFNTISGYSQPQAYRKIEAAPLTLHDRLIRLIESETERSRQGQKAAIMAKINSLAEPAVIEALYRASQAGVKIQLNVRGICCLAPGVPGLSDNISVVSVVDRFLEHSRILCFHQGGRRAVYISSADWMPRNLHRRIELLVPVEESEHKERLADILKTCLSDNVNAWELGSDGTYTRRQPTSPRKSLRSQARTYESACHAVKARRKAKPTLFEPHRAP